MSASNRTVQLGESTVELRHFSAYKMLEVTDCLAGIGETVPEVLQAVGDFVGDYEVRHAPTMARATAEFEYGDKARGISEAAWDASDQMLRMPAEPSNEAKIAAVFPLAFRKARLHTTTLLALVALTNRDLEDADTEGADIYAAGGLVDGKRKEILHRATTSQMVKLLAAAVDVCKDEIASLDPEDLGNLLGLFGVTLPGRASPSASSSDAQPSSSGSPRPSRAGRGKRSSTASRGASSAPSPAG